ncbi:MAG: hypothetical protein CMI27_05465 [Opitutae bacterium]|nr:hypothetical protein [Opitutae bacterium]|tara:strand:- start:3499 stop:4950 length:1452 start_codon:yes stop_codon:yes gene_type:complete
MARRPFFSGNYGSSLGSTANAANLIAQAGAAQGKMFQNLGSDIGGAIEKYGLNKEKRAKLTDKIENRIKLDPSIAQRLTTSGDEDYDKKNLTLMEKLSTGELGLKGLETLDSAMATIREVDLQKQQEQDSNIKTQMSELLLKEQNNKNKATEEALKLAQANKLFVQQSTQGLVSRLAGLSKDKQKEAYDSFDPTSKEMVRRAESIMSGNFDPSNFMPTASERLGMQSDLLKIEELRGNIKRDEEARKDRQKASQAGVFEAPPNAMFINEDGQVARVGTPSENIAPPVASPETTPPTVFDPVDAKAFRGQFTPQIVDTLDRAYSYLTGESLPGTDQKEIKKQIQNLSTIGNAITPVLLAELGGKVTNLMIERVEKNIPLATDNVTKGREKIGQLVDLAKSQLSRAETFIETLNPGTQAYAEALGVKRFLEVNIPMLEQSIGADRPSFSDPSIERILGNNKKPNDLPIVPSNRSKLTQEDLLKML